MLEREIEKHELPNFVGDVRGTWTNPEIFTVCRFMQEEAKKQNVIISNIGRVYHWVIEIRDKLKDGKKRRKTTKR